MKPLNPIRRVGATLPWLALASANAVGFYGLSRDGDRLFTLQANGAVQSDTAITGLLPGDSLVDLDVFASGDGRLYGLGTSGALYTIQPQTGTASINVNPAAVGSPTAMDFNPAADRLRIFSGDANYRLTPGTGVVSNDGSLAFAAGDANSGVDPTLVAAAYINNVDNPGATTLFSLDAGLDALIRHSGGPQFSTLNTVVPLTLGGQPFNLGSDAGFDVFSTGVGQDQAFVSNGNELYRLDLASGVLASIGWVSASAPLGSIAAANVPDVGHPVLLGGLGLVGLTAFRRALRHRVHRPAGG